MTDLNEASLLDAINRLKEARATHGPITITPEQMVVPIPDGYEFADVLAAMCSRAFSLAAEACRDGVPLEFAPDFGPPPMDRVTGAWREGWLSSVA